MKPSRHGVCAVAIARDESKFIHEWLAYHRIMGVEHFVIYDDDPALPLARELDGVRRSVTVVPWYGLSDGSPGRNRQTKAYWHFHCNFSAAYEWVTFIDIDEFVVIRDGRSVPEFLAGFDNFDAVSLNWHVFGHNGFFEDPPGLVTEFLTKRMAEPSRQFKSITRPEAITAIESAHSCVLKPGSRHCDGNGRQFANEVYKGITERAHINHYQCRSFERWMRRVTRGDVTEAAAIGGDASNRWRIDAEACLRHFVETVARDKNECHDMFLRDYAPRIRELLGREWMPDGHSGQTARRA